MQKQQIVIEISPDSSKSNLSLTVAKSARYPNCKRVLPMPALNIDNRLVIEIEDSEPSKKKGLKKPRRIFRAERRLTN